MTSTAPSTAIKPAQSKARVLWIACGAHALHDGFTDALYVLLPLWQAQFALSYAAIGCWVLEPMPPRTSAIASMATLELAPSNK